MTKRCFVIMPFSGKPNTTRDAKYWISFYKNFLKKTVEDLGYECKRSDASSRSIVGTIVSDLFRSDVVLAVLTDFNPNVFYELGVRHSLMHGTIMAIEEGQTIPFDLSQFGVIFYDRNKRLEFGQQLKKFILDIERRSVPDSPVGEFLKSNDVSVARISADIKNSPLDVVGSLTLADSDLMIVGQNLYGLANNQIKQQIFSALKKKAKLRVRILFADSNFKPQVLALAQIIDELIEEQFPQIDRSFEAWLAEWNEADPRGEHRLEVRRCKRVGNVSATLVDTGDPNGIILIRPVLYHTQPNARPCHWLTRNDSPRVFDSYKSAFEQIWSHGESLA